ncbi:hypothetical protein M758_2G040500 [Ceratodon purpureus]|nr:hypothetical protein M758_2G040500 [Ceratodon purpureus]
MANVAYKTPTQCPNKEAEAIPHGTRSSQTAPILLLSLALASSFRHWRFSVPLQSPKTIPHTPIAFPFRCPKSVTTAFLDWEPGVVSVSLLELSHTHKHSQNHKKTYTHTYAEVTNLLRAKLRFCQVHNIRVG